MCTWCKIKCKLRLKLPYIFHTRLTRGSRKTIKMWQRSIAKEERYLHVSFDPNFQYLIYNLVAVKSKQFMKNQIFIHIGSDWNHDLHSFDLPWAIS